MSAAVEAPRRRIVVGVDGSKSSIGALLWAQRLAPGLGAEIDAVTTWQYPINVGATGWLEVWDPAPASATMLNETISSAYGPALPAGLRSVVRQGHPAQILVDASAGAELLVVGSRGHGGFVGLLIGATSAYCAEHARCAVLIAHDSPGVARAE